MQGMFPDNINIRPHGESSSFVYCDDKEQVQQRPWVPLDPPADEPKVVSFNSNFDVD